MSSKDSGCLCWFLWSLYSLHEKEYWYTAFAWQFFYLAPDILYSWSIPKHLRHHLNLEKDGVNHEKEHLCIHLCSFKISSGSLKTTYTYIPKEILSSYSIQIHVPMHPTFRMGQAGLEQAAILFCTCYQNWGWVPLFLLDDLIIVSTWVPIGGGPEKKAENPKIHLPSYGLVP